MTTEHDGSKTKDNTDNAYKMIMNMMKMNKKFWEELMCLLSQWQRDVTTITQQLNNPESLLCKAENHASN
jgi:hypothetical protein